MPPIARRFKEEAYEGNGTKHQENYGYDIIDKKLNHSLQLQPNFF
jgi:hypothetical protein